MFRIKICGMTSVEDARAAAEAGADAIGLNFYPRSRRFVRPETAARIAAAVPRDVTKVGVFVNATAEEIRRIAELVGLDCVQLHGDEPPALVAQLPPQVAVVRAYRCTVDGLAPLAEYLAACPAHGRALDAVLVDADAGGDYGGTGQAADWSLVARERDALGGTPLVLAGGLTPENVSEAIAQVHPDGVDVASGVESRPGRKDAALVARFVAAAREALERYVGQAF
jgi:phosphoribosylanthranilate isomerase